MKVDKLRDFIERVGWTFIQVEIGFGLLDWLSAGINLSFLHILYGSLGAAAAATIKVILAQRIGSSGGGDAIPGGVETTPTVAPRTLDYSEKPKK